MSSGSPRDPHNSRDTKGERSTIEDVLAVTTRVLRELSLVALGSLAALLVFHRLWLALGISFLVLALGFLSIRGRVRFLRTPRPFRWIPLAWCLLLFVSNVKTSLEVRAASAVVQGNVSSNNKIELLAYFLVALAVFAVWFHLRLKMFASGGWPLLAWPLFGLASTAWSPIPLFTFVRAAQLLVVIGLALLCLRLAHDFPELGHTIVVDSLRLFVVVTTLLSLWGLVNRTAWTEDRFMWPTGQHPILVGMVVAAALLIVLVGGYSLTRFPWPIATSLVILFSIVLLLGRNRGILISVTVALVLSLWIKLGQKHVATRFVALLAILYASLVVALFAGNTILEYLSRGESAHSLETLTGRTDLWATAVKQLKTPAEWLVGFGYGSPRVILEPLFEWAGQAHNSLIELLLSLGLIGATIGLASYAVIGHRVLSPKNAIGRTLGATEAALFAYLVAAGMAESVLVIPGFGFTMLALVFVSMSLKDPSNPPVNGSHGFVVPRRQPGERSASIVA
jgi:O-antigen ligase